MTDEAELLQRILDNPDEDTHRLTYADWLEEHGEPERAEFIRVQCEIAALPQFKHTWQTAVSGYEGSVWQHRDKLLDRERELWRVSETWFDPSPLPKIVAHPCTISPDAYAAFTRNCDAAMFGWASLVQRGFIEAVTCTAADWLTHADAILARHPVRRVTLSTRPDLKVVSTEGKGSALNVVCTLPGRAHTGTAHDAIDGDGVPDWNALTLRLLAAEWSRIEFTVSEFTPWPAGNFTPLFPPNEGG